MAPRGAFGRLLPLVLAVLSAGLVAAGCSDDGGGIPMRSDSAVSPARADAGDARGSDAMGGNGPSVACAKPCDDGIACSKDSCNESNGTCVFDRSGCPDAGVDSRPPATPDTAPTVDTRPPSSVDTGGPAPIDTAPVLVDSGADTKPADAGVDSKPADAPKGDAADAADAPKETLPPVPMCPASCDDKNPCTADACDMATGKCKNSNEAAGKACDDGKKCTEADKCDGAGACKGTAKACTSPATCDDKDGTCKAPVIACAVACDDKNPCTADACDTTTGMCKATPEVAGKTCDDGKKCTETDKCDAAGVCKGTAKACTAPSTCDDKDGTCKAPIPNCPASCDDGNACTVDGCDKATGVCTNTAEAAGKACDDGKKCTDADKCDGAKVCKGTAKACTAPATCRESDGTCVAPVVNCTGSCDDGNACTADSCDTSNGTCKNVAEAAGKACDDGKKCTDADKCDGAKVCKGTAKACTSPATCDEADGTCKSPVVPCATACNDNNPCTTDSCDTSNGTCKAVPGTDGTSCDDGKLCTEADKCAAGVCGGAAKTCTGGATCDPADGVCKGATPQCPASCDDGNPCTDDECGAATSFACKSTPKTEGTSCDDRNLCTETDKCTAGICGGIAKTCTGGATCDPVDGACKGGTTPQCPASCDDGNPCTDDTCSAATGFTCKSTGKADGVSCDDGKPCTQGDACTAGACNGAPVVCNTPPTTACKAAAGTCDATTGTCLYGNAPANTACDDAKKCTSGDKCDAVGVCVGAPVTCSIGTCSEAVPNDGCPTATPGPTCPVGRSAVVIPQSLPDPGVAVIATATGIAGDDAGTLYAAGALFNTVAFPGGKQVTSTGAGDLYVSRVNPATGAFDWVANFGDDKDQNANNLAVNKDGVIGVIGGFAGTMTIGPASVGPAPTPNTPYLAGVKAADGAGLFGVQIPLGTGGLLSTVAASPTDGGFVVCGTRVVSSSNRDLFVAKYTATGTLAWDASGGFAAAGTQACGAVAVTDAGDVVFLGVDASKLLVAKLAGATGAKLWTQGFAQASGTPTPSAIASDAAGDVVISGVFNRALTIGAATFTPSGEDVFVAKLTGAAGDPVWSKGLGEPAGSETPNTQQGKGVAVDAAGNLHLVGIFKGEMVVGAGTKLTAAGTLGTNDAYYVVLKGSDGSPICAKALGDEQNQTGNRIVVSRKATGPEKDVAHLMGTFAGKVDMGGGLVVDAGADQRSFLASFRP